MDWQAAININRQALLRIIAVLVAITAPSHAARNTILRVLRPAESAVRRLIMIATAFYAQKHRINAPQPKNQNLPDFSKFARGANTPAFKLFDPRKRFDYFQTKPLKTLPRISVFGVSNPVFPTTRKAPHDTNAHLIRRLKALQNALHDLPREAKRLARHIEKRKSAPAGPRRVPPLRPGLPPGHCLKSKHEVRAILRECHALAVQFREAPT